MTGRRTIRSRWARARDERGAVAVFTAVVLSLVLIGIAAFTVDLGMQRVARRDMQALADIVALDLARELDGRSQAQLAPEGNFSSPASAVRQSVARNDDTVGDGLDVEVDWGSYIGGAWNTAAEPPTAVRVTASSSVGFTFADGDGDVSRTAYGTASSTACYRLGSFVAAVNSGDGTVLGPLNHLFDVNLKRVGYQALAAADVTLGDLAASSYIGSSEELLTRTVTYSDLIRAMIEVLSNEPGSTNDVAIDALKTMLKASAAFGSVALGNVLHVAPTDAAALEIDLQVLDVLGSARFANGQHFLEIPNLQAGVAGLGSQFTGSLALISAAELACGRPNTPETIAKNPQLTGTLGLDFVNLPSANLGIGTLQTPRATGTLFVEIGNGTGQLVSPPEVYCGDGTAADPHTFAVQVATSLATYRLSMDVALEGELQVSALEELGLGNLLDSLLGSLPGGKNKKTAVEIGVTLSVGNIGNPSNSTANLSMPPNDETPVESGSAVYLNASNIIPTITSVKIGGKSVTSLSLVKALTDLVVAELTSVGRDFVQKTVAPLLENLDEMLIGPAARMVGLRFAGADVYAEGAVCGHPALSG